MLRISTLTLWVIKEIKFRYSLIIMKTLEKNETLWQTERLIHTKLLISLLLIA